MTAQTGKTTDNERGLLPYPVIIAAGNEYCRASLRRLYRTPFYEKAPR